MGRQFGSIVGLFCSLIALSACGGGGASTMSGSSSSPTFSSAGQGTTGAVGGTGTNAPPCSPASPSGGPYCLTFVGTSFDVHVGQQFKVALLSSDGNDTVSTHWEFFTLPAASFWVNLPHSMTPGTSYYIGYYADNNRNGKCDPPIANGSSDHVYRSYTQLVPFNNAAGTITTIQTNTTQGDFAWVTMHSDPWIDDPTGQNTCTPMNSF